MQRRERMQWATCWSTTFIIWNVHKSQGQLTCTKTGQNNQHSIHDKQKQALLHSHVQTDSEASPPFPPDTVGCFPRNKTARYAHHSRSYNAEVKNSLISTSIPPPHTSSLPEAKQAKGQC